MTPELKDDAPMLDALALRVSIAQRMSQYLGTDDVETTVYVPHAMFDDIAREAVEKYGWLNRSDRDWLKFRKHFIANGMRWEPCDVEHPVAILDRFVPGKAPLWIRTFPPEGA